MDVVALAQSGFGNAVATLGTACTAEHVQKLFRFTDSVVFSFDGDAAGRRAAGRALEASLLHAGDTRTVRFLFLPPEHDPDSYVREFGAEAFEQQVAQAVPLSRQLVEAAKAEVDTATAEGRAPSSQARPLWNALPGACSSASCSGRSPRWPRCRWRPRRSLAGAGPGPELPRRAGHRRGRRTRRRGGAHAAPAEERALWALLLESGWWAQLSAEDHETLCALQDWHGEAFRLIDRLAADEGTLPWAGCASA